MNTDILLFLGNFVKRPPQAAADANTSASNIYSLLVKVTACFYGKRPPGRMIIKPKKF